MHRQKHVDIDAATILITLLISLVLPSAVFKTRKLRVTRRPCIKLSLHKKCSFPLTISSVNVTKSAGNCLMENFIFCAVCV